MYHILSYYIIFHLCPFTQKIHLKDFEHSTLQKEQISEAKIFDEKIAKMTEIIDESEKNKSNLNEKVATLQREKNQLISIHKEQLLKKEKDSNDLQIEIQTVRNDLKNLHCKSKNLEDELEISRNELKAHTINSEIFHKNSSDIEDNLQKEIIMLKADKDDTKRTLTLERDRVISLNEALTSIKDDRDKGKAKMSEKEELVASLSQKQRDTKFQLSTLEKEITALTARQSERDGKMEVLTRDTTAERGVMKTEISTLKTKVEVMNEELSKAKDAKVESDKQIVALSTDLKQQKDSHIAETEGYIQLSQN